MCKKKHGDVLWLVCVLLCPLASAGWAQSTSGFTLTVNPPSASTPAGTLVSFTITVTPGPGAPPLIGFTCTDPIPASACSFNPTSVNTTGGPVSTTMSVATNFVRAGAKADPSRAPLSHSNKALYAMLSLGGAGILGLVLPASHTGNKRRRWLAAITGLLVFLILMALQGCGGIKQRTTPGNYSLTVTAASINFNPPQTATANVGLSVF